MRIVCGNGYISIGQFSLREEAKGGIINGQFLPTEERVNVEGGVIFGQFLLVEEGAIVTEGEGRHSSQFCRDEIGRALDQSKT